MDQGRSTPDIVWGCLATLILCVWVAFHPHIPSQPRPAPPATNLRLEKSFYSFRMMFFRHWRERPLGTLIALLAPEMTVGFAYYDWMRAKLCLRKIKQWASIGATKQTHSNNSVARTILPIIAPAAPSIARYCFVQEWTPIHAMVYQMRGFTLVAGGEDVAFVRDPLHEIFFLVKRGYIQLSRIRKDIEDRSKGDWLSKAVTCIQASWFLAQCITRIVQRLPMTKLELTTVAYVLLTLVTYAFWWHKPLNVSLRVPIMISDAAVHDLMLFRNRATDDADEEFDGLCDLNRLDDMGEVGNIKITLRVARSIIATMSGCVFGVAHCFAWTSEFPTEEERLLWRICSITVTVLPVIMIFNGLLITVALARTWKCEVYIMRDFEIFLGFLYVLARVALIMEAFLSLRSMPAPLHQEVKWTTFFPHV